MSEPVGDEQMEDRRLILGGVEFLAPHFADTVVNGFQIIEGDVITEGVYDVRRWSASQVEVFDRAHDAYLRFKRYPRWIRSFLTWWRGDAPSRPLRQRVMVVNNYATGCHFAPGVEGVTAISNVFASH